MPFVGELSILDVHHTIEQSDFLVAQVNNEGDETPIVVKVPVSAVSSGSGPSGDINCNSVTVASGADNHLFIGEDNAFPSYNIISFNGKKNDTGNLGLVAGANGDDTLYLETLSDGGMHFLFTDVNTTPFTCDINGPHADFYGSLSGDVGMSRTAAATVAVGNGTVGNSSGTLVAAAFETSTALVTTAGGSVTPSFASNSTGGTGQPATATQNSWLKMKDSNGATVWIPVWK